MSDYCIPFNRPCFEGNEQRYMAQAIANKHISGDGHFTRQCHALLERELGIHRALLTTSCTDALEMAALLLEVGPGDEVIVPSFTFVSTANAFALRGATPVFVDIRPDTLNLDEAHCAARITPRTRAIVVVHYAGVACEMDAILRIAGQHGIAVVEDNAHGLFGRYRGRYLGTFGSLATLSFHETKNFTCGEGGALLINEPRFVERAEILREKGTDRSRFFRGQVDKYTWVDIGSSFLPSDLLAAFLYAQLEARARIQERRRQIWEMYHAGLREWAAINHVRLPVVPPHCEQSYHMFYLLLPSFETRQELIAHLRSRGIQSVFHYLPLHLSAMGQQFGGRPGDCPVTEDISNRLLRLPFYNALTPQEQMQVIEAVCAFGVPCPPCVPASLSSSRPAVTLSRNDENAEDLTDHAVVHSADRTAHRHRTTAG
ncbi:MAG: dTDP-4-amino-4,6-dideoxygalactose transaminase [Chloroherpetonaceae bacterium]|nr:dTDP-4-amino-4,6-dideoxygalactose transaminase [Chthonomonadaceae bacterium]MDW8208917.1 dTDP-4-amino-4,6-dideoxygalactose transaminase [Chloroherpetonaceae bacterium]